MGMGASWRFVGASDTPPNLNDANVNSLDAGANVYVSPNGGLNVRISPAVLWGFGSKRLAYAGEVADLAMTASSTNYVFAQLSAAGALVTGVSTTGWPTGEHIPLAEVVAAGATIASIADRRPRVAAPPHRGFRSSWLAGQFYGQGDAGGETTATLTADTLYGFPWLVGGPLAIDQIAIAVVGAGAAGEVARLGLYAEDTANPGQPGSLLEDLTTTLVDVTGLRALALGATRALDSGLVFPALVTDSGTATFRAYSQAQAKAHLGLDPTTTPLGQALTAWRGAPGGQLVGSALPDPFPAMTAIVLDAPVMGLRAA